MVEICPNCQDPLKINEKRYPDGGRIEKPCPSCGETIVFYIAPPPKEQTELESIPDHKQLEAVLPKEEPSPRVIEESPSTQVLGASPLPSEQRSNRSVFPWFLVVLLLGLMLIGVYIISHSADNSSGNQNEFEASVHTEDSIPSEEQAAEIMKQYYDYVVNEKFYNLEEVMSNQLIRFHSYKKGISLKKVIQEYINYTQNQHKNLSYRIESIRLKSSSPIRFTYQIHSSTRRISDGKIKYWSIRGTVGFTKEDGKYKIDYIVDENTKFLSSEESYIETIDEDDSVGYWTSVTADRVNLRSSASISSNILGQLNSGDRVYVREVKQVMGSGNEALLTRDVYLRNSATGYTFTLKQGRAVFIKEYLGDGRYKISFNDGSATSTATVDSDDIEKVSSETWAEVETEEGQIGWTLLRYVR